MPTVHTSKFLACIIATGVAACGIAFFFFGFVTPAAARFWAHYDCTGDSGYVAFDAKYGRALMYVRNHGQPEFRASSPTSPDPTNVKGAYWQARFPGGFMPLEIFTWRFDGIQTLIVAHNPFPFAPAMAFYTCKRWPCATC